MRVPQFDKVLTFDEALEKYLQGLDQGKSKHIDVHEALVKRARELGNVGACSVAVAEWLGKHRIAIKELMDDPEPENEMFYDFFVAVNAYRPLPDQPLEPEA